MIPSCIGYKYTKNLACRSMNISDVQTTNCSLFFNSPHCIQVLKEAGPPHMKSFMVRVSVGEYSGEGDGKSKKIAKKLAAIAVLEELRGLPQLPVTDKIPLRIKKKSKSIIKVDEDLYLDGLI